MKSKHRHELETNWLAKWMADWIDELRPYSSTLFGAAIVIAVALFGFSFFSGSTSARQAEAWSSYNEAVEGWMPNIEELRLSAQEHAGSTMQRWADMTWADGHVWIAARDYVYNHAGAMDALNRAAGTYRNLLEDSNDERLKSRAHFGLGRVYEMRGELDKARDEYLAVRGGFQNLAEARAKALDEPAAKKAYDWLVTAQAPRRSAPAGPGTPGQRPDFSVGGLDIPSSSNAEGVELPDGSPASDLFGGFELTDDEQAPADENAEASAGEAEDANASEAQ